MNGAMFFHNLGPDTFYFFFVCNVTLVEVYILALILSVDAHNLFHFGNHGRGQVHGYVYDYEID